MAGKRIRKKHSDKDSEPREEVCPLCGDALPDDPSERVYGITGRAVCATCLGAADIIYSARKKRESSEDKEPVRIHTPQEIRKVLDQSIIGQDEAKDAISVALGKQQLRRKGENVPNANMLFYGPTGCGKTALIQQAAKAVGLPFISFDATTLTEAGYRGRNAGDMVCDLANRCGTQEKVEYGVIFVDEVDKLAALKGNDYRAVYSKGTQHSLLKVIEGTEIDAGFQTVNTEHILFIFGGAFSGLTRKVPENRHPIGFAGAELPKKNEEERALSVEDFIEYGMEPELMGRIGRCVPLHELNAEDMKQILLNSSLSVYRKYQCFFEKRKKGLYMSPKTMDALIQTALQRGVGARGLNALVEEWVEPKLAQLAEELYEET